LYPCGRASFTSYGYMTQLFQYVDLHIEAGGNRDNDHG
jgi:hypothetical protein